MIQHPSTVERSPARRSSKRPLRGSATRAALTAALLGVALEAACSERDPVHGIEATPSAPVPRGEGVPGANGPTSDAGAGGAGARHQGYELGAVDGGIDPDAGCASSTTTGKLVAVDLLLMVDRSGSMADDGKWEAVSSALDGFFADPASAGLRVALRFFPDSGCESPSCSTAVCSKPLVDLAPLTLASAPVDAQEAALVAAVASRSPGGNTPMHAALAGAEAWAAVHQNQQPGEKATVVLVTDGEPNGCDDDIGDIASLAAAGRVSHGVLTYAVGLAGSNVDHLNLIAQAGGTDKAFFLGNGDVQAQLLAALKQIQGKQIACDFPLPPAPGGKLDPALVNVIYVPGDGSPALTIGHVESAAFCAHGGWYFDAPASPTRAILCNSTCAAVRTDVEAKVDIVLGCASVVN